MNNRENIKFLKLFVSFIMVFMTISILFIVNKTENSSIKKKVYKTLTSKTLLNTYKTDAFEDLIDQVIIIEGTLKEVHFKNDAYTLYINHDNETFHIMCELKKDESYKINALKTGQTIMIKGVVKGHLLDIILLSCVII